MALRFDGLMTRYDDYRAIVSVGNAYQEGRLTADEASRAISQIGTRSDVLVDDVTLVG